MNHFIPFYKAIITELQLSFADYVMRGVKSVAVTAMISKEKCEVNHQEALHQMHTVQYLIYQKATVTITTMTAMMSVVVVRQVIVVMSTLQIHRYETMKITLVMFRRSMSIMTRMTMVSLFFVIFFPLFKSAISSQNSKIDFDISLASLFSLFSLCSFFSSPLTLYSLV